RRRRDLRARRRQRRRRAAPRGRRARNEGRVPAPQHLQRPALARPALRPALGRLPGAQHPHRLPRDHWQPHEGRRHRPLPRYGPGPHLDPFDGTDARLHGHHHGRRHGAVPEAALRVSRSQLRLAAVLAAPHGRALRVARALWRDDPSDDAALRIFPPPGFRRGRVRRNLRQACGRSLRRRQPRHHHRLPARRLEVPEGDGPLHGPAAQRQQQAENPVGQRRQALRAMKIGFIGVGNIGAPIAGQLLAAGHVVTVHDLRPDAAQKLIASGAAWSDSAAALAAENEIVATCLPGPPQMEAVLRGIGGHLRPGALYIDHTTNAPSLVRRIHAELAARGVAMLDAPVSGGMEGARTRDLLVMAGGDPDVVERARPLLDTIAKRVMYTGGIGTGSIAKIMHNSATFTLDLVMAECWTTAVKAGIDADTIVKVFTEAALGNQMNLKVRLPATYLR